MVTRIFRFGIPKDALAPVAIAPRRPRRWPGPCFLASVLVPLHRVVPGREIAQLSAALASAPFVSGSRTAAPHAALIKNNLQLPADHALAVRGARTLLGVLMSNPAFQAATLPATMTVPRFCRYDVGMGYGDHHDSPMMNGASRVRTDIAVTVSLTEAESYGGGELVIDTDGAAWSWKGGAGDCVIYPGSTRHRVEPVLRGVRLVAIMWIQSLVRDPEKRRILYEMTTAMEALRGDDASTQALEHLRNAHANLLRMWAEP